MNDNGSLDSFLYQLSRKQKWAGLFTFAMTALGLVVILGLIALTTWGFASYEAARSRLVDTSQQLEVSQKKIGELEALANSNPTSAEVLRLNQQLSEANQSLSNKNLQIANLEKRLENNNSSPTTPPVPADCSGCQKELNAKDRELERINGELRKLSQTCEELKKRCGRTPSNPQANKE